MEKLVLRIGLLIYAIYDKHYHINYICMLITVTSWDVISFGFHLISICQNKASSRYTTHLNKNKYQQVWKNNGERELTFLNGLIHRPCPAENSVFKTLREGKRHNSAGASGRLCLYKTPPTTITTTTSTTRMLWMCNIDVGDAIATEIAARL